MTWMHKKFVKVDFTHITKIHVLELVKMTKSKNVFYEKSGSLWRNRELLKNKCCHDIIPTSGFYFRLVGLGYNVCTNIAKFFARPNLKLAKLGIIIIVKNYLKIRPVISHLV